MDARKMVAKYAGHCPICDRKIKAGSDSIRVCGTDPVAHWACHERMGATEYPSYRTPEEFAADRAAERALWDAAVAAKSAASTPMARPSRCSREERGSFGGSQIAEDMGVYR